MDVANMATHQSSLADAQNYPVQHLLPLSTTPVFTPDIEYLTQQTMTKVREYFDTSTEHRPSDQMYVALSAIAEAMSEMAVGDPEDKVYLSSLDPGIGKTTVLTAFVDTLLEQRDLGHVGIIILVSRLDEVRSLVNRIGIPREMLAVLTANDTVNALGDTPVNKAQVLITTQQGLERKMQRNDFSECTELFFKGSPRQVRIWDETWLPGDGISVGRYQLSSILESLIYVSKKFADAVEDMFREIRDLKDHTRYTVPNWEEDFGVTLNDVIAMFDDARDNRDAKVKDGLRSTATHLFIISGKTVVVRRDGGQYGEAVVTYEDKLPLDLMPLVVLDASGRVRKTYEQMEKNRRNIVRLPEAGKDYSPLTVHVWQKSGGKSAFRDPQRAQELIEGISNTINRKPREAWLVVAHKPSRDVPDVEAKVRDLLAPTVDQSKVHFITWGNHAATNAYADVPNVILAGTLFLRPSQYEALGRLSSQHPDGDKYPPTARSDIESGEHAHGVLQALCRAAVRQCRGDQCAPCDAYVIASVRSGIGGQIEDIFPGCRVAPWDPVDVKLTGKVGQAVHYLQRRFGDETCDFVKFKEVQAYLNIRRTANFRDSVRLHQDFRDAIAKMGVIEYGARVYSTEFRRNGTQYGFDMLKDES